MPENSHPESGDPRIRPEDHSRVTTDDAEGAERRSFQTRPGEVEPAADDWGHTPTTPQANRAIDQGLGAGAREIRAQADPAKGDSTDHYSDEPDPSGARS